jgi:hypothetical protein
MPNWLKQLVLVIASLFVGIFLSEAMLRIAGSSYPVFMQPDNNFGWSFRHNVAGWSVHENTAHVTINRFGFRGSDWPAQPVPDKLRIAVLGDSFVDSTNLSDEHALTSVIERHFAECSTLKPRSAEFLNFGVSGYSTAQEYLLLQHRVRLFRPHLVLLAFYAGNDVMDNSLALSVDNQKARPYFIELSSGEIEVDMGFRNSDAFRQALEADWQKRLINRSYVLQQLKQVYLGKIANPLVGPQNGTGGAQSQALHPPESSAVFSSPVDDTWRSAWSVTEKLLLQMRGWAHQQNVGFELIIVPSAIQALPGFERRQAAAHHFNIAELDYPVNRIAFFAQKNGISYLSLLEILRAYADRERTFLYGFPPNLGAGHLNATGNLVAGKSIADWLCRRTLTFTVG